MTTITTAEDALCRITELLTAEAALLKKYLADHEDTTMPSQIGRVRAYLRGNELDLAECTGISVSLVLVNEEQPSNKPLTAEEAVRGLLFRSQFTLPGPNRWNSDERMEACVQSAFPLIAALDAGRREIEGLLKPFRATA